METKYILVIVLILLNVFSFALMAHDKRCAKAGKRRVPEKTLFIAAACFGGLGGVLGMFLCRHKTKHWYFRVFFPVFLEIQILILVLLSGTVFARAEAPADGTAVLSFSSFEGGGPEIMIEADDPSIVAYTVERNYDADAGDPLPPGTGYTVTCIFTGLRPGQTVITVRSRSSIAGDHDETYAVSVDESLHVTLKSMRSIVRFEMTRSTDLPSRIYELFILDGGYYLYDGSLISRPVGADTVAALEQIAEEYAVASWNGFSRSDPRVLDGESFRLDIEFSDGSKVHADGNNAFPDGYFAAADAMEELLCGTDPDPFYMLSGVYRYEGSGSGGDLTVTIYEDGTYTFRENALFGRSGSGEWFMSGARLYMSGNDGSYTLNVFIPVEDALVFLEEDSDNFFRVRVPDKGRFEKIASAYPADGSEVPMVVGLHVPLKEITDFYYTYATSTFPPEYQRYRFYAENGDCWFYHETREGVQWPLTEDDITDSGTLALGEDAWTSFLMHLKNGCVDRREESVESGNAGPWMYLYWTGDEGIYQEFAFDSYTDEAAFERFCESLRDLQKSDE